MSTAVQFEKAEKVEKIEKKPQPAAVTSPPVVESAPVVEEGHPLRRDRVALFIWVAGALILLLWHLYDVLLTLFS